MRVRMIAIACAVTGVGALFLPYTADAACPAPCAYSLCGETENSVVFLGSEVSSGTIRIEEMWGAPTDVVHVGDEIEISVWPPLETGERVYGVFAADTGIFAPLDRLRVDAAGNVSCHEGVLPLDEAVALSTSATCWEDATRAGFGDAPCNDVVVVTDPCAAGGGPADSLGVALGIGLLALASRRRR